MSFEGVDAINGIWKRNVEESRLLKFYDKKSAVRAKYVVFKKRKRENNLRCK